MHWVDRYLIPSLCKWHSPSVLHARVSESRLRLQKCHLDSWHFGLLQSWSWRVLAEGSTSQQNNTAHIYIPLYPVPNELYRIGPAWLVLLSGTHISICSTWAGKERKGWVAEPLSHLHLRVWLHTAGSNRVRSARAVCGRRLVTGSVSSFCLSLHFGGSWNMWTAWTQKHRLVYCWHVHRDKLMQFRGFYVAFVLKFYSHFKIDLILVGKYSMSLNCVLDGISKKKKEKSQTYDLSFDSWPHHRDRLRSVPNKQRCTHKP